MDNSNAGTVKTLEQLRAEIAAAADDPTQFGILLKEYNKRGADIAKDLAEQARLEAEQLSGARVKLAAELLPLVNNIPDIIKKLAAVKAEGFRFLPKGWKDSNGVAIEKSSIMLIVPVVKTVKTRSGGNGGKGNLQKAFDEHATDDDKARMAAIEADYATGRISFKQYDGRKWKCKNDVKKAAIAAGKLAPEK